MRKLITPIAASSFDLDQGRLTPFLGIRQRNQISNSVKSLNSTNICNSDQAEQHRADNLHRQGRGSDRRLCHAKTAWGQYDRQLSFS